MNEKCLDEFEHLYKNKKCTKCAICPLSFGSGFKAVKCLLNCAWCSKHNDFYICLAVDDHANVSTPLYRKEK